jgi:hypothetical protein
MERCITSLMRIPVSVSGSLAIEFWIVMVIREEFRYSDGTETLAVVNDEDKIDETVLALLRLTLHDDCRAWEGFDWQRHRVAQGPTPSSIFWQKERLSSDDRVPIS